MRWTFGTLQAEVVLSVAMPIREFTARSMSSVSSARSSSMLCWG
jgi:hypothetical protein